MESRAYNTNLVGNLIQICIFRGMSTFKKLASTEVQDLVYSVEI